MTRQPSERRRKILLACYGGGHVQSLIPVAKALANRPDTDLQIIGFTTAFMAFQRAGLEVLSYSALLEEDDEPWLALADQYAPPVAHRDIATADNRAYHALGLRDLVLEHGEQEALEKFKAKGRTCFLPGHTFRRYLQKTKPDLVVTSSSPRSEVALLNAATSLGIETLAITDLFLQAEAAYVCAPDYAANVTVLSTYVREYLEQQACHARIWVTGNPAFDLLVDAASAERRDRRRAELGVAHDQQLIMWVCPSAQVSLVGKTFANPSDILAMLKTMAADDQRTKILVRQHPNRAILERLDIAPAAEPPEGWSIEDCLAASDCVLVETSTVGLQAALLGRPVVTINAGEYPPYAKLGLSIDVPDVNAAAVALKEPPPPCLDRLGAPDIGSATANVLDVIETLLNQNTHLETAR